MTNASHRNGVWYYYSTYLSAGNHTYYFMFNDSKNSSRYPVTGDLKGPSVSKLPDPNNPPRLYYGYVYPVRGTNQTNFTYYVYYYDADNDTPTMKYVVIDGVRYDMKPAYTGPNHYGTTAAGMYSYTTKLPVGNHTYYFIFSDGTDTVRLPKTGNYSGPQVVVYPDNKSPVLWNGRVTPTLGNTSTEFVYSVHYRDPEGKAPTTKIIYIDGVAHAMSYVSGSYGTNATFQYKTTLSVGTHSYHFLFSDGTNTVKLPSYGSYYGPVVKRPNRPPVADAGSDQLYTVGPPKTVWFNGSGSYDPDSDRLTYFWDFGDGGYAYGMVTYHVFHGVGTYDVKLTVSDGKLTDTDNCSVKIIDSGKGKTQGKAPKKEAKLGTGYLYTALGATIAGSVILAGVVVAGTEWGLYALLALILPLYVRIKGEKILDNFIRGKIYGYIIANPGDHYNSIRTALKLKNGALAYHLKALEREELVKSQTDGKFKRFYPYEMSVPKRATKLTTMRENIVEQIKERPGITQNEISEKMGVSHQAISYHLRTLVQLGAVEVEKKGRANHCYPGEKNGMLQLPEEEMEWT
jgi:predicted transcriptional regulator